MSNYPPSFFSDEIELVRCIAKEHRTDGYLISTAAYKLRSPEQMLNKKKERALSMGCLQISSMEEIKEFFWDVILRKEQEYGEICSSTHTIKKINTCANYAKKGIIKKIEGSFTFEEAGQSEFSYAHSPTPKNKSHTSVSFLRAFEEIEENVFATRMRNLAPKADVTKRKSKA